MTTAHPAFDVRIFHKECKSLAAAGHCTTLIAPYDRCECVEGVNIRPIPAMSSRFARMMIAPWRVYREAMRLSGDVYHFHDPELIPVGLLLRARGKTVVYDMHENVPQDILGKEYLPAALRRPLGTAMDCLERVSSHLFSGMIAATPAIARRFAHLDGRLAVVQNFPAREEFGPRIGLDWNERENSVVYAGSITRDRAIREMVEALTVVPGGLQPKLRLAGVFSPPELRQEVQALPGWDRVVDEGLLTRPQVRDLLGRVRAGLLVLHPTPNYVQAQPVKLFEYMAAGLPVIASDFPLWREIIDGVGCGLLVDPLKPNDIAAAIEYLLTHSSEAQTMGARGRQAVLESYQWDTEKAKLLRFYARLV
ncbi:MAG: glycosyltransferase family 4 protein [Terriglobia bacterium]